LSSTRGFLAEAKTSGVAVVASKAGLTDDSGGESSADDGLG